MSDRGLVGLVVVGLLTQLVVFVVWQQRAPGMYAVTFVVVGFYTLCWLAWLGVKALARDVTVFFKREKGGRDGL